MSEISGKICFSCGEGGVIGYAVAAQLKKRSNAIYYCPGCRNLTWTLCKCMNTMNRRLEEKHNQMKSGKTSECSKLFEIYSKIWNKDMDQRVFPNPREFVARGIKKI